MSLRLKFIAALLSLAAIPMIVMGAWIYLYAQNEIETAKIAELQSTANLKVQKIEEFVKERKKDILLVQNNSIIKKNISVLIDQAGNPTDFEYQKVKTEIDDVLKIKNKIFQYKINIIITDPQGKIIYSLQGSNNLQHTENVIKTNNKNFFISGSKGIHFSDVFIVNENQICILIMVPAYDQRDESCGIIAFELEMNALFGFIQDTTGLGKTGETIIAKNTVNDISFLSNLRHETNSKIEKQVIIGEKKASPIQYALQGKNGWGFSTDYRGEEVLAVWRNLPQLNWGIVTKIDISEAFAAVFELKRIIFIIGFISVGLSIIVALLFSYSITKPIEILKREMELIGKSGELNLAIDTNRKDEIGVLANEFYIMAKNLKNITASRDELNKEISDRQKAENQIQHLNQVLQTIRKVNKHITSEKDTAEIIRGACNILTENRGYHNAWIALMDEGGKIISCSESGIDGDFIEFKTQLMQGKLPKCSQKSIESMDVVTIEDPKATCIDCPLANKYGGRGAFSTRLEYDGKIYGLLSASIPKNIVLYKEEQSLFLELAKDIAYALNKLEIASERECAELAMRRSEKQFQDLVENSPTGISIIQDRRIVYQNPEQEKLLGPLPRPILFTDYERIYPDDIENVRLFNDRLFSKEIKSATIEYRFFSDGANKDNIKIKWVHVNASWVEFQGKESILINILNITKSKELEKIIRTQDKMSSLGRVAAGIAHEIRNPLSGINIYLETLRKSFGKDDSIEMQKRIIDRSKEASIKIETIIKRVLDFSRPGELKFILSDINHPIEEAIHLSSVTLRKTNIQLSKNLDENLPKCLIDSQMIEQVILNIITNATEAMKDIQHKKKVELSSSLETDCICIKISDSGPGVPDSIRNDIFDPFYTTKKSGSGIGLSICHRIIADHKGMLTVASNKVGGAEFKIQIPIKTDGNCS